MMNKAFLFLLTSILFSSQCSAGSSAGETYAAKRAAADLETCTLKDGGDCINPDAPEANNSAEASSSSSICLDDRNECPQYAARGECKTNSAYMLAHCKLSCGSCPADLNSFDIGWGEPQESYGENSRAIEELIRDTEKYMNEKVFKKALFKSVKDKCLNRDKLCSKWATEGECEKNPNWMQTNCAPACRTCEKLDHRIRCPWNHHTPNAWNGPDDINKMFTRITTDPYYQQYEPSILSRPSKDNGIMLFQNTKVSEDAPWVVSLENFLTEEECDRLMYLGGLVGYKQSYEVGGENFDGTYRAHQADDRTSYNAWCFEKDCYDDKITQQILAKVENVTAIPEKNSEFFQLLRYEVGGLYREHSDYVPGDYERAQGVRIMTFFIYLNDMEEEAGGETAFPRLGLKIRPKKGKAVLWQNVYLTTPDAKDLRANHEALPVKKGVKYAANLWIHQRDFKTPFYMLCN